MPRGMDSEPRKKRGPPSNTKLEKSKKAAIDGQLKLFNIGASGKASRMAESAPVAVASLLEAIPEATMAASLVHDPPAVVDPPTTAAGAINVNSAE